MSTFSRAELRQIDYGELVVYEAPVLQKPQQTTMAAWVLVKEYAELKNKARGIRFFFSATSKRERVLSRIKRLEFLLRRCSIPKYDPKYGPKCP